MNEDNPFKLRQIVTQVVGTAGVAYVDYTPAAGIAERVCFASGMHDDVAARDCSWALIQGGGYSMQTPASRTSTVRSQLYEDTKWAQPLILRPGITLRFNVTALGAGKFATMNLLVERLCGDDTYGF